MQAMTFIGFFIGIMFGALGCYLIMARSKAQSSIEQQLRELQEEFTAYRENVNTHFNKTAQLVNTLTDNYISVQKHLEDAADSFAEPPKSFQLDNTLPSKKTEFVSLEAKEKETVEDEKTDAEFDEGETMKPPRDYAPKSDTKAKGTLSEEFGLHDN
ncbi:MAG: YhcB family protein [Pseudomonadales bacterium]|nr:YhcB family protein [Pseudomonadales bacterium]